jgi:hypothetical protein
MSAGSMLRTQPPTIRFANRGPRYVLPIPAPSGRPLTKGASLRLAYSDAEGCRA